MLASAGSPPEARFSGQSAAEFEIEQWDRQIRGGKSQGVNEPIEGRATPHGLEHLLLKRAESGAMRGMLWTLPGPSQGSGTKVPDQIGRFEQGSGTTSQKTIAADGGGLASIRRNDP